MKKLTIATVFCFGFVIFFLSGLLNIDHQYIASGQNETSSNITITISNTISKEAQNALINITIQTPEFVTPGPNDVKGWDEMNKQYSSMFSEQSQSLIDKFKP